MARDAEVALIGCAIINPTCIATAKEKVKDAYFEDTDLSRLWASVVVVADASAVDAVTLNHATGGKCPELIAECVESCPNAEAYEDYIRILREEYAKRRLCTLVGGVYEECKGGGSLERIKQGVGEAASLLDDYGAPCPADYRPGAIENLREVRRNGVDMLWGIKHLDVAIGGLRRGILYTVGGRTSQGKTSVAINVAARALIAGKKVVYNGVENMEQVFPKLASVLYRLPLDWYTKPYLCSDLEYSRVEQGLQEVLERYGESLYILQGATLTEMDRVCKEVRPDAAILDYIQRYAYIHSWGKSDSRVHDIGKAISDLQDMAIRHKLAMVVLSQFSRQSDVTRGRDPRMEDLKESGEIENMSDVVLLLQWKWKEGSEGATPDRYRIHIAKTKLGQTGVVDTTVDRTTMRIGEWI